MFKISSQPFFGENLGLTGSVVFTFFGYKHTDKQTDRQAKYNYRFSYLAAPLYLSVRDILNYSPSCLHPYL